MVLPSVLAVLVSGALAIAGTERARPLLLLIFKPLTTALLLVVVGRPETTFARLVDAGIVLSVIGDAALLRPGNRPFMVGLAAFLLAHLAYVAAFLGVAVWSPHIVLIASGALVSTTLVLRAIWRGAAGMHAATVAYGVVISLMVVSASATLGGPLVWAPLAAVGSVLFYVSDTSLALDRFRRRIPHVVYLTLGIYWLGQLGIALAARGPLG